MEEDILTINEMAKRLNITKQSIYNRLNDLTEYIVVKDNVKYLKVEAMLVVKDSLKVKVPHQKNIQEEYISSLKDEIEYLRRELLEKNKQLASKDQQLENKDQLQIDSNELMKNMQVLLNNYNKKQIVETIEQNRKWWEFWKS